MGKYRSKTGCMTCRQRRVKCDEVRPVCGQCGKKARNCEWETAHSNFRGYRHSRTGGHSSSSTTPYNKHDEDDEDMGDEGVGHGGFPLPSRDDSPESSRPKQTLPGALNVSLDTSGLTGAAIKEGIQRPTALPFLPRINPPPPVISGGVIVTHQISSAVPVSEPVIITQHEAIMVHHYAQHLGRWLDCTDPKRQFSLRIPHNVKRCPILFLATLCFSARHLRDEQTASLAYSNCISLLIERLNLNSATQDNDLLCAIVILRFFEQLNVLNISGSDSESHLAGSAAILRDSPRRYIDPTAPTLHEAAFWIYVRQCLYNATIDQQPPNIDFSLKLRPEPSSLGHDGHMSQLTIETAWANQMTWICASVVKFCFDDGPTRLRQERWQSLYESVQSWGANRPANFDPLWESTEGEKHEGSAFPQIYFTADWHVVAHGYYHFSSILLLTYKPGPKFVLRNVRGKLSESDNKILDHARAICGSCKCSPKVVPCLITLCHTICIWGPLLSDEEEQKELLEILMDFENRESWPTIWIRNALKREWGMEEMV